MSTEEIVFRLKHLVKLAKDQKFDLLRNEILKLLEENASLKSQLESNQVNGEALFEIDINPGHESTPVIYDSKSSVLANGLDDNSLDDSQTATPKPSFKNSCFNCGGDHQVPECPLPRDGRRIAQNRQKFLNNTPRSVRYHADENQKFGHLKPGLPSKELRIALGLRDYEIPSYIYRMREHGLSPGWLKAVESNSSGLDVYLERDDADAGITGEEGEVVEETNRVQYDLEKVPEWPGFNSPLPENYRDESNRYRVPQIDVSQFKSTMCEEYKRKSELSKRSDAVDTSAGVKRKLEKLAEQTVKRQKSTDAEEPLSMTVVSVMTSTPICGNYSGFNNLPESEKWTTNTTDHLLYENLPESTGNYEKLREIIQKVRETKSNS